MKMVRRVPITLANLTSDVAMAETLWTSGATFALGAAVYEVIDGVPMRFVSKVAGNIGHQPSVDEADPTAPETYWKPEGATNRWAFADGTQQTQTVKADSWTFSVQLGPNEAIDTIRLANVSCAMVRVKITDGIDGVIHDVTYPMSSDLGIDDYLPWFSLPIVRKAGITIGNLPSVLYPGCIVEVTLAAPGEDVKLGLGLLGLSRKLGGTRWGAQISFRDLSVKAEDPFGGLYIAKRTFKRSFSADVIVHAGFVDELQRLLEEVRAEPTLFIGSDDYDTMAIYGYVKSYKTLVNWKTRSLASLEVESLA